jgi:hypothetical protein
MVLDDQPDIEAVAEPRRRRPGLRVLILSIAAAAAGRR